jgi:hypothetical protein
LELESDIREESKDYTKFLAWAPGAIHCAGSTKRVIWRDFNFRNIRLEVPLMISK